MRHLLLIIGSFCLAVFSFGCGHSSNSDNADSVCNYSYEKEQAEFRDFSDSADYRRFKRFNLFSLCGEQPVSDTPCVYVKQSEDLIIVKESSNTARSLVFRKWNDGWHLHREKDMEYENKGSLCYCDDLPNPYIIDNFFYGDTIFEYFQTASLSKTIPTIVIYTDNHCYIPSISYPRQKRLKDPKLVYAKLRMYLKELDLRDLRQYDTIFMDPAFASFKMSLKDNGLWDE